VAGLITKGWIGGERRLSFNGKGRARGLALASSFYALPWGKSGSGMGH
jgi:hypothetical protein